jgi:2-polyprenyl-6-methoxyphenol hydroxylase-like FAD-dependent oxidoreductase
MDRHLNASADHEYDVAIVGYGPVGQILALLLARAGHDVLVLERWEAPYDLPRAVHFDDEIGRIFQSAGVGEQVRAITDPVPDFYEWRNRDGAALVRIDWSGLGPSGWPTANFFCQPELERVLTHAVDKLGTVTVRRGQLVTDLSQDADHVILQTQSGTFHARYAIGADGANSLVRSRMRTSATDLGYFFDWLIVDTLPQDFDQVDWSPMNWQLCDPARPTTIVSGGPGRRRWEFMRLEHESIEELNTTATAWRLLEPWGRTPRNTTLERHTVYTFQARWAENWHDGRLLLAGDAAHQMPPFAGQGMCSGLRDAINLAWKLDLILRGIARPELLDTYSSERRAHVQHAISMSIALGEVICVLDPHAAAERDRRMIADGAEAERVLPPMPPPVLGDGVLQTDAAGLRLPTVGHLTPQHRVRHGGASGPLDDVTGFGFTILSDGPTPGDLLDENTRAFLASIGATVLALTPDTDLDNAYLPRLREHGHAAAIIRPDFYLYGTATSADDLNALINQLRTQLNA